MASFSAGTTFTDGVANDVTAAKLAALVNAATPTSGFIQDRTAETSIAADDTLLFGDFSDSSNLKRMTVANFAGTLPTATITSGTITTLNSTTGTITTGVIPTLTSTTLITTGTGTAAAPAIVPTGDTNTGIFFPAADTLAATTNGTERLRIDSSGNVGIGTTSPSDQLHINKSSNATIRLQSSSNTCFVEGNNNYLDLHGGSQAIRMVAGSTEALRIDSSGNVGIGTASPSYKLQVTGNTNDALISASGSGDNIGLRVSNTQTGGGTYRILAPATGSGYPVGGLVFEDQAVGARMVIDSSGGVTIAGLAGAGSRAVNASAAGLLSAASDASLKEEVFGASIAGLNEILQIHPKMYRWKDDIANRGENASVELGFIANDVAPIIPSAAPLGNDGLYGFYDRSITAALVKAVQELKAENDSLKSRIEALEVK